MTEPRPDTDITAAEVDGRIVLGRENGESGEWLSALWAIPEVYWQ